MIGQGLDINVEHTLQALRPGDRCVALGGRWRLVRYLRLVSLASLCGRHPCPVFIVGRKHAVKACEADSWRWRQCGEAGDKIQWLEDHMRGAIPVRRLQLVANVAIGRERQPRCRHRWTAGVAAQTFQLVAFMGPGCNTGMQTEPNHFAHCVAGCAARWLGLRITL